MKLTIEDVKAIGRNRQRDADNKHAARFLVGWLAIMAISLPMILVPIATTDHSRTSEWQSTDAGATVEIAQRDSHVGSVTLNGRPLAKTNQQYHYLDAVGLGVLITGGTILILSMIAFLAISTALDSRRNRAARELAQKWQDSAQEPPAIDHRKGRATP